MKQTFLLTSRNRIAGDMSRHVLEAHGFSVAGIAYTTSEVLPLVEMHKPTVIMVGSELDDATGLQILRSVSEVNPTIRRVLFVLESEPEYSKLALDEGVEGLLTPDVLTTDFLACAAAMAAGGRYIYAPLRERLLRRFGAQAFLSSREQEVFSLIAEGVSSKRIAEQLDLSLNTVNRHRANIAEKLDLHGPNTLAQYAMRHGLNRQTFSSNPASITPGQSKHPGNDGT